LIFLPFLFSITSGFAVHIDDIFAPKSALWRKRLFFVDFPPSYPLPVDNFSSFSLIFWFLNWLIPIRIFSRFPIRKKVKKADKIGKNQL